MNAIEIKLSDNLEACVHASTGELLCALDRRPGFAGTPFEWTDCTLIVRRLPALMERIRTEFAKRAGSEEAG